MDNQGVVQNAVPATPVSTTMEEIVRVATDVAGDVDFAAQAAGSVSAANQLMSDPALLAAKLLEAHSRIAELEAAIADVPAIAAFMRKHFPGAF
jgi:hypothetical protein